jgi:hypothetical protein
MFARWPVLAIALSCGVATLIASPSESAADGSVHVNLGTRERVPQRGTLSWNGVRVAQNGPAPAKGSTVRTLIDRAQEMFDDQRYEESIQTLSGALVRPGASTAERTEVLKLLAFNHIALTHNDEADAAVRALLVLDDSYELPKNTSPRFRDFFSNAKKKWEDEGKPGKATDSGSAPAAPKPVTIKHAPPAEGEADTIVPVEGTIDDPDSRVAKVELFYRAGAKGTFTEKSLAYSMGSFRGQIPETAVLPPLVEYYLLASDSAGLPVASRGDVDAPLRIAILEESEDVIESPWFWIPLPVAVVGGAVLTGVLVTQLGGEDPGTPTSTIHINVGE